jgi:predicted ATP-binding protein involved in virulence
MRLTELTLKNYRCFESISIPLHAQLTVIVAENGQGKSTLLDAIRVGLWPFIGSFDLARASTFNDPQNSITIDDARLIKAPDGGMGRKLPAEISLTGDWGLGENRTWTRFRASESDKTKTKENSSTADLRQWARQLQTDIRDEHRASAITLPVFGYYGTGRLWAQKNLTTVKKSQKDDSDLTNFYIRTFGYLNCMDPASSFKHFREWFIWAWEVRRDMQDQASATAADKQWAEDQILAVQGVIDTFLHATTGWHGLRFSRKAQKSLVLDHDEHGEMRVEFLSDGVRSMLALAGDLAHRCMKLNRHLGARAALETHGVVLIDEVDMHLHPRWQQLVLTQLLQAFPKIQFIVTTHSPQVLTTVKPESIRGLKNIDGKIEVRADYQFSEGAEAQLVLEDILGVEARPSGLAIVQDLNAWLELVHQDQWDSEAAKTLRARLNAWSRGNETILMQTDMDIRLREFRRKRVG